MKAFKIIASLALALTLNGTVLPTTSAAQDDNPDIRMLCKTAMLEGGEINYPNGQRFTRQAGAADTAWYYPNGSVVSQTVGVPGSTFYYENGSRFSSNTGEKGATWYHPDGAVLNSSGAALDKKQLFELACDLIIKSINDRKSKFN